MFEPPLTPPSELPEVRLDERLDLVPYHGGLVTIPYDSAGTRYHIGKGLRVFADGAEVASSDGLGRVTGRLR